MHSLLDDFAARVGGAESWSDAEVLEWANRWCVAAGHDSVSDLSALPAVTTDVYRYGDTRPLGGPPVLTFRTSGTTAHLRGEHHLTRTDVYRAAALVAFSRQVLSRFPLKRMVALVPPPSQVGDSSLSHMLGDFAETTFEGRSEWVVGPEGLDETALREALFAAEVSREATLVFATTLAAAAALTTDIGASLPAGSLILTTGGAKGRRGQVDPIAIEAALGARFDGASVGAEYGMTELLSQAYRVGTEPFLFPPWCRVLVMDPLLDVPVADGDEGLLRVIDLANMESAIAVQTADRVVAAGPRGFHYRGRAAGAVLRGCSVTFEDLTIQKPEIEKPAIERPAIAKPAIEAPEGPASDSSPPPPPVRGIEDPTAGDERRVLAVLGALRRLAPRLRAGDLAGSVSRETHLSAEAAEHALQAWCGSIDEHALRRLLRTSRGRPATGHVLTLASGNVPIVAAEAVLLAALAGGRHVIALSTRAAALAEAAREALIREVPPLADQISLVVWREQGPRAQAELLTAAERVVVYGSADTVEWIAVRAAGASIVPHGPTVAVAVIAADEVAEADWRALARDVATWEQRGCRSPHAVIVVGDGPAAEVAAEAAGEALYEALREVSEELPVASARPDEVGIRYLDRLTSSHLGRVWHGPGATVSVERSARALRVSPLGRTVRVVGARDQDEVRHLLETLPVPCNLLLTPSGVAPDDLSAPEVGRFGDGQGAPFDRRHDGMHRLDSLRTQ